MTAILAILCYYPLGILYSHERPVTEQVQHYRAQVSLSENSFVSDLLLNVSFHLVGKGNTRVISFYRPDMIKLWGGLLEVYVDGKLAPYVDVPKHSFATNRRVELFPGDKLSVAIRLRDIFVITENWRKIEIGFTDNAVRLEKFDEHNKLILQRK